MADTVIGPGGATPAVDPEGERIVGFWGRRKSLFGILMLNAALGLITLGIYRFWARTRLRQFFWNSIAVDGEPLEYTGRGLELFIGFLIVIAVLVPLLIAYQLLSVFLQANAPDIFNAVNFLYFITLFWLTRYAFFRARRYRLARTVWRGIRGGQDGSAAGYAWLWFGYAVLSVITLGWAVPWMTAELQKYEVENARFGVENFRYEGTGTGLLRAWVPCAALWSLGIVIVIVGVVVDWAGMQRMFSPSVAEFNVHAAAFSGLSIITFIVSIPFYFYYRITALRYMLSSSNLSEVGFVAEFSGWRLVGYGALYFLIVIGLMAVVVLLFSSFSVLAALSGGEELTNPGAAMAGILLSAIPIILLLFFLPMMSLLFFYYPAIRHIATTLRLTEISSLERIVQSSKDDPRFGEGLAAALDVDVGGF
jgi:uncharacterized membrane protein YjgN (DUF898 family)